MRLAALDPWPESVFAIITLQHYSNIHTLGSLMLQRATMHSWHCNYWQCHETDRAELPGSFNLLASSLAQRSLRRRLRCRRARRRARICQGGRSRPLSASASTCCSCSVSSGRSCRAWAARGLASLLSQTCSLPLQRQSTFQTRYGSLASAMADIMLDDHACLCTLPQRSL